MCLCKIMCLKWEVRSLSLISYGQTSKNCVRDYVDLAICNVGSREMPLKDRIYDIFLKDICIWGWRFTMVNRRPPVETAVAKCLKSQLMKKRPLERNFSYDSMFAGAKLLCKVSISLQLFFHRHYSAITEGSSARAR